MINLDPVKVLKFGLQKSGHPAFRHSSIDKISKLADQRFRQAFGIGPNAISKVFTDLQTAEIMGEEVIENVDMDEMMMALRWLRIYDTESNHAGFWNCCENTARWKTDKYVKAFQKLKNHKVKWIFADPENPPDEVFIASVDGIHCQISEIRTKPDKVWCSYKNKKPGVVYELAIAVYDSSLVWINGPFPAGTSDLNVFRAPGGLKEQIPQGKRLIADQGYLAEKQLCSLRNPLDTLAVKQLKARAKARHETFNKRLKEWNVLSQRFRSTRDSLSKHKTVFEACCVLTQYDIEDNHPLFDV
jgi:hypothetical protein